MSPNRVGIALFLSQSNKKGLLSPWISTSKAVPCFVNSALIILPSTSLVCCVGCFDNKRSASLKSLTFFFSPSVASERSNSSPFFGCHTLFEWRISPSSYLEFLDTKTNAFATSCSVISFSSNLETNISKLFPLNSSFVELIISKAVSTSLPCCVVGAVVVLRFLILTVLEVSSPGISCEKSPFSYFIPISPYSSTISTLLNLGTVSSK